MTWPEVSLGDVCVFKYGKGLAAAARDGGQFDVYGSNGVVGLHSKALSRGPTIIIGRKGSFGEVKFSPASCWPIDTTYYVDASATNADLNWLSYRLASLGLTGLNRAAAIPGLNRDDAYRKRLLLPPIDAQRRIAAILDQADALRAKRRQVFANLDALSQSIFHNMFSHEKANATVAAVARHIRTGPFGSQLRHGEFVDEGVAVIGLDNVVSNEFCWSERRYITASKYDQLQRYTVQPSDVLISIMGTVGRCVVVPKGIPLAISTKHVCAITPLEEQLDSTFLRAAFLWHPDSRAHLLRQTKGSIMDGLNMGIIKAMPIPLPSLGRQLLLKAKLDLVGKSTASQRFAASIEDHLFASLQSRAFRGEL
ncbi:MAG: restriction endonuclease subunit S [Nocardioidaceae bacterium]